MKSLVLCLLGLFLAVGLAQAAPGDVTNAQDPAGLARLPGFEIVAYHSRLGAADFPTSATTSQRQEGQLSRARYQLPNGAKPLRPEEILAHYSALTLQAGGEIVYQGESAEAVLQGVYRLSAEGRETWLQVEPAMDGLSYDLLALSKGAPPAESEQDELLAALEKDGRVALYLDFDPGRAELKPEARPVLGIVAEMLKEHPQLSLRVEGHTDDQGRAEDNRALSLRRAQAVVQALVQAGVARQRLSAKGWGPDKPLTTNETAEGRAQNQRVELVKP